VKLLHLLAPFAPFITEYLYQQLVVSQNPQAVESIHLSQYPEYDGEIDELVLNQVEQVKVILEQGFKLREVSAIKVRQPLQSLGIEGLELADWMKDIIRTEINVKEVVTHNVSDNSIEHLGYILSLDDTITDELREEGLIRELIRNLQITRKNARLSKEQNIKLSIDASEVMVNLIKTHQAIISDPVGVIDWEFKSLSEQENTQKVKVEQEEFLIYITVFEETK
jgi:isoleucyl-tRNA synthetase